MRSIRRLIVCLTFFNFFLVKLNAQKIELPNGYYINQKGKKVTGFFDMELFRLNIIKIKETQIDVKSQTIVIDDVKKIVLENGKNDSTVILTEKLTYKGQEEIIYIDNLLRGDINLFRGFSKNENELFFISSKELPVIRRINGSDPKAFLFTYFPKCEDVKQKIKGVYYDKTSLERAISLFAECSKSKFNRVERIKYVGFDFKKYFSVGIKGIGSIARPKILNNYYEGKYISNSIAPGFGISFQLNVTNRLSISTEFNSTINNSMKSADSLGRWINGEWESKFLFKAVPILSYRKIEYVPFEVKYQLLKNVQKFESIVSLGFILNKIVSPKMEGEFSNYSRYELSPTYPAAFGLKNPPKRPSLDKLDGYGDIGFFVTAAIQKPLSKLITLGLGLKYTYSKENIKLYRTDSFEPYHVDFLNTVHRYDLFTHLLFTFR